MKGKGKNMERGGGGEIELSKVKRMVRGGGIKSILISKC